MRIGLVIYGALDTRSGGYLYDKQVVDALRARGHHVEVMSLPWTSYGRRLLQNASPRVRAALTRCRVDVLVQDELNHPSLFHANRLIKKQGGPPICTIVHHLRSDEEHPILARQVYRWIERAYLRTVDGAICNSRTTQNRIADLHGRELRSCVAFPAGDHIAAPGTAEIVRRKQALACSEQVLRVLFVGNVIARKGLHHVVEALAAVRGDWQLTVVGNLDVDRRYVAHVRAQVARLRAVERVHFLGRVSDATLRGLYASHHVLALPSFEGYGIAYLEAMAYAMPCVASSAGSAHEIVSDGLNGFLIAPGNVQALTARLEQLAADRNQLAEMGVSARRRYDAHPTWADTTSVIEQYLAEFAK